MLDCTSTSLCVSDRRSGNCALLHLGQLWTLLVSQEKEAAYWFALRLRRFVLAAGGMELLVYGGEVPMESWLATYRCRKGGTVQCAAALVTQLFEVMLGKRATSH